MFGAILLKTAVHLWLSSTTSLCASLEWRAMQRRVQNERRAGKSQHLQEMKPLHDPCVSKRDRCSCCRPLMLLLSIVVAAMTVSGSSVAAALAIQSVAEQGMRPADFTSYSVYTDNKNSYICLSIPGFAPTRSPAADLSSKHKTTEQIT